MSRWFMCDAKAFAICNFWYMALVSVCFLQNQAKEWKKNGKKDPHKSLGKKGVIRTETRLRVVSWLRVHISQTNSMRHSHRVFDFKLKSMANTLGWWYCDTPLNTPPAAHFGITEKKGKWIWYNWPHHYTASKTLENEKNFANVFFLKACYAIRPH